MALSQSPDSSAAFRGFGLLQIFPCILCRRIQRRIFIFFHRSTKSLIRSGGLNTATKFIGAFGGIGFASLGGKSTFGSCINKQFVHLSSDVRLEICFQLIRFVWVPATTGIGGVRFVDWGLPCRFPQPKRPPNRPELAVQRGSRRGVTRLAGLSSGFVQAGCCRGFDLKVPIKINDINAIWRRESDWDRTFSTYSIVPGRVRW